MRFARNDRLVIASHNAGKVVEIAALLKPYGIGVEGAAALGLAEPAETASDFVGNAVLKARAATQATGLPALADDSGLAVRALNGAPGIHAARWAEIDGRRDFDYAMRLVEAAIQKAAIQNTEKNKTADKPDNPEQTENSDRHAQFICALALSYRAQNGALAVATYEGTIDGAMIWPPRGTNGFGYDASFVPQGYVQSFGEMLPAEKHAISHRARAFAKLVAAHFA